MPMSPLEAMKMAIEEGKKGFGFVAPNPLVGCVILDKNDEFLAKGYHAVYGQAHAEVNALAMVKEASRLEGAHVYVTLEPCAHEGKTGSCAKALAKLPVASVTFGLIDPFAQVNGAGAEILRAAGKRVEKFVGLETELEELCEVFLLNQKQKRPFVALKVGASLDGKIALENGKSQWITGESARAHAHYLRGGYDAILAGAGTILKDRPRLNSRHPDFRNKVSRVVILDPGGETVGSLKGSPLLEVRKPEDVILVTHPNVTCDLPIQHIKIAAGQDGFDLNQVLAELYVRGIRSLFVEGGAHTYSGFLRASLVDRLYLFLAPKILGRGLSWTEGLKHEDLDHVARLTSSTPSKFGEDFFFTGKIF